MNPLFALLSLLVLNIAMAASPFLGDWTVTEAYGENREVITLPEGSYTFKISEGDDAESLKLTVKVGNSMRTRITLLEPQQDDGSQSISVGGLMSTMMMPPAALFRLETYLSDIMPKMESMQVVGENLVFEGEGKIVCVNQA
jgi:hypothetical protein